MERFTAEELRVISLMCDHERMMIAVCNSMVKGLKTEGAIELVSGIALKVAAALKESVPVNSGA